MFVVQALLASQLLALVTDASSVAVGVMLEQKDGNR